MFSEFHFLRPLWLLSLPVFALLLWGLRRRHTGDDAWRAICDPHLLPHLLVGDAAVARYGFLAVLGVAWLVVVVALAGPTWSQRAQQTYQLQKARVIALDLSLSMLAGDLQPSRLAQARFKVEDILRRNREGVTGLVAFAGDAFTVAPLTHDTATIQALLDTLEPSIMPVQGSRLDRALDKAAALLKQAGYPRGEIILVTDSPADQAAREQALKLRQQGIRVSVLMTGTVAGAPIPLKDQGFLKGQDGSIVIARLDEPSLMALAQAGGGRHALLRTDNGDLNWLLAPDDGLPLGASISRSDQETLSWREEGPWLVLLLLPLAAVAFRRGWLG
ncbi:MAG: VWA domain-containing protein [Gammaproteobacteria bacterium]|nr:VWA domain-containing protein [Gammaproteobacteria bacterium]MCP5458537.1 VWA domain-containing protein [Gammaproteobacteria bacterium]